MSKQESKVKKFGKIRYVEPNDFLDDKTNNITHPQEDYSIYVDLLVRNKSRMGSIKNNDTEIILGGSQKSFSSFYHGNEDFLTDSPSFTTYKDVMNNTNTNESLGITNINITYNSYFYPEVTINFTDIRGTALMMPEEENYRREQVNNAKGKTYTNTVNSFFKSLFSFPYPEFILRVKGFYGKMIEYSLLVSDFKSSFNNETGNFDATLKLIGRMYGVYTDIPMSYLVLAPYCKYGGNNGKTLWEEYDFKIDGVSMPTFLKIKDELNSINDKIITKFDDKKVDKLKLLDAEKECINNIITLYNNLKKSPLVQTKMFQTFFDSDNDTFYIPNSDFEIIEKSEINKTFIQPLIGEINNYNSNYGNCFDIDIKISNNSNINSKTLNKCKLEDISETAKKFFIGKDIIDDQTLTLKEDIYILPFTGIGDVINNINTNINKKFIKSENELKEESALYLQDIFGFKPTLKNIFKILMAHLQTFVNIYCYFLSRTTGNNERSIPPSFVSSDISNINKLPPFPSFIKNNEFCYPDENIEEKKLVESLLLATNTFIDIRNDSINNDIYNNGLYFIPTCLSDFVILKNPYALYKNMEYTYGNKFNMLFIFAYRCQTFFFGERRGGSFSDKMFGKLEAYNFWKANKDLDLEMYKFINSEVFDSNNFLQFMLGKEKYSSYNQEIKNPLYYDYSSFFEKYFFDIDSRSNMIHGNNRLPLTITRDGENLTCISDRKDRFNEFTEQGWFYTRFIDKNTLKYFSDEIKKIDLTSFSNNTNDTLYIIDAHLKHTEWFYPKNDYTLFFSKKGSGEIVTVSSVEALKTSLYATSLSDISNTDNLENYNLLTTNAIFCLYNNNLRGIIDFLREDMPNLDLYGEYEGSWSDKGHTYYRRRTVITLPYRTKLFYGALLDYIEEVRNKNLSSTKFVEEMLNFPYLETEYVSLLRNLAELTRDYEGDVAYFQENKRELTVNESDYRRQQILRIKDEKLFTNDFLKLRDSYREWVNSEEKGGYKYFVKYYGLLDEQKHYISYIDFKEILKKFKGENNINFYNKKLISRSIPSTGNDFTDRFSYIRFIEGKNGDIKNVVLGLNDAFIAYDELNRFYTKEEKIVIPYVFGGHNYKNTSCIHNAFNGFKEKLIELYKPSFEENIDESKTLYIDTNNDIKLSVYKTLKNLHDKHFSSLLKEKEKYDIKNKHGEFNNFYFIDTFYRDLSDELLVNIDILNEVLSVIINGERNNGENEVIPSEMSVYSFMSLLCQKHNLLFLSLPVFKGIFNKENGADNLEKMFTPYHFNESFSDILNGPSYVCFYPHQPSQHLDCGDEYTNDGFDIIDINDTGNFNKPNSAEELFKEEINDEVIVPAFGVEYGSQKQSIFKNINVNMDNPQITEAAVATQFNLINSTNDEPKILSFQGQDLFKIYSNYSYTCNVEMMGCAQIQPLMYFQLNNIPMFRGAYQIVQVNHNITPGNMTTSFRGVRINRTKMPIIHNNINLNSVLANLNKNVNIGSIVTKNEITLAEHKAGIHVFADGVNYSSDDLIQEYGDLITFANNEIKKNFDTLNQSLRNIIWDILCLIKEGYSYWEGGNKKYLWKDAKYSLYISSATRNKLNKSSDHYVGADGRPSKRRTQLTSLDCKGNKKPLTEMGCAVDFYMFKNGKADKGETTIQLFYYVAKKFERYVRQLIWETNKNSSTLDDNISNCIHLSSYGKESDNDIREVFVASSKDDYRSVRADELPLSFIKILQGLCTSYGSLYKCNNLQKSNIDFKLEKIEDLYKRQEKKIPNKTEILLIKRNTVV